MKISLSNPDNEYGAMIDTDVMNVLITEAYLPATFVSNAGEEISICIRDNGFELMYLDEDNVEHHYSFNDGFVRRTLLKGRK